MISDTLNRRARDRQCRLWDFVSRIDPDCPEASREGHPLHWTGWLPLWKQAVALGIQT